jgi:cold-inducible RNA-binding protein
MIGLTRLVWCVITPSADDAAPGARSRAEIPVGYGTCSPFGSSTHPPRIEKLMGNRLYVGNLSFNATTDSVREAFSQFGEITDVHVVMDRETGQSRGFGFVTLGNAEAAQKAIREMNGALLDGRALKVNEAEERPNRGGGGGGGGGRGGGGGGRGGGGGGGGRW